MSGHSQQGLHQDVLQPDQAPPPTFFSILIPMWEREEGINRTVNCSLGHFVATTFFKENNNANQKILRDFVADSILFGWTTKEKKIRSKNNQLFRCSQINFSLGNLSGIFVKEVL